MFRNQTQRAASFASLATLSILLSFAAGCTNSIVGPVQHQTSSGSVQEPRTPPTFVDPAKSAPPTTAPVLGDLTGDGNVDASDLAAFAFIMRADINQDGMVDGQDEVRLALLMSGQVPDLAAPYGVIDASDYAALAAARGRADLTGDGHLDASDVACFTWMRARGDLNGDGIVSRRDREIIAPEVTP
jgi:hypothetical protein